MKAAEISLKLSILKLSAALKQIVIIV